MKVYISKYRYHWLSPYTILKKVCFWERDDDVFYNHEDVPGHKYDRWVSRLEPVCQALQRFLDVVHPKVDYVRIDRWDTWSMDHTLGLIALPMLRQLKATKHGAPNVDDADVPEELRSTSAPAKVNEWDIDDNHFRRWDWVLDEMIFAFEHKLDDSWEEKFKSGEVDIKSVPCEWDDNGKPKMFQMVDGPNHTRVYDWDGINKVQARIQNGFCLFGKYYQNLWD
jgi:hypothetical protein